MNGLTVGQLAEAAGVNAETVKYYERRGLLTPPLRTRSGYRLFAEAAVEDIRLIKKAQGLGFTLAEIKELLALVRQDDYYPTKDMYAFAVAKIGEIEAKIAQLEQFRSLLKLVTDLPPQSLPLSKRECPVITLLTKG